MIKFKLGYYMQQENRFVPLLHTKFMYHHKIIFSQWNKFLCKSKYSSNLSVSLYISSGSLSQHKTSNYLLVNVTDIFYMYLSIAIDHLLSIKSVAAIKVAGHASAIKRELSTVIIAPCFINPIAIPASAMVNFKKEDLCNKS